MGKVKEMLENFTVGDRVIPYAHRRCPFCDSWFRFRHDEAAGEIRHHDYFKVVCPDCDREYVYERVEHLPTDHMKFAEVE